MQTLFIENAVLYTDPLPLKSEQKRIELVTRRGEIGGEHHLVQSAVNEDILASNLFEMGSSSCQHHISQEHFANKNLHLDALPGVITDYGLLLSIIFLD